MTTILRVVVAVIAATLFLTWVAPALAQDAARAGGPYRSVQLVAPAADATVHDNGGNVEVMVIVEPGLDVAAGHRLGVSLDDRVLPLRSTEPRFVVGDIDRGEHTLRAVVVGRDGATLMRSDARTIHVWRASRLFPNR